MGSNHHGYPPWHGFQSRSPRRRCYFPKGCSMGFEPMSCLVHSQVLCLLSYKHHLAEIVGFEPTHGFPWLLFSKQAHYQLCQNSIVRKAGFEPATCGISDRCTTRPCYSRISSFKYISKRHHLHTRSRANHSLCVIQESTR